MKTLINLALAEAYSVAWGASIADADSRIVSSSQDPGAMTLAYSGASSLSGNPPGGGFGILLRSRAAGSGSGTVDLSMIPSTALITQLRVRAYRGGAAHSTWLWTYVSGPAPPTGGYSLNCSSNARVKVTAVAANIADNTLDADTNAGAFFPGGTLFVESHVTAPSAENTKTTGFASITKAAFLLALHNVITAVIGDSVAQDADNVIGANGGSPFDRLIQVDQTIDGNLFFGYIDYEVTWTDASVVFGLTPNTGPTLGGTSVSITGAGFTGATDVKFGGESAESFIVVNDGLIVAVSPPAPPSVVMVSVIVGAASTEIALYTYVPSEDYWTNPTTVFPPRRVMIVSPNVGTNYSRGKTVTMVDGTPLANYPATKLVDDSADSPLRVVEKHVELYVDLGATRTPDAVALLNHNLDRALLVQVLVGASPSLFVEIGNFAAGTVNGWLDLRAFPSNRTGRYWKIRITTDNSVPITMGELVIGSAYFMEGVVDPDWKRKTKYFVAREFTEEMLPYKMHSGTRIRQVEIGFTLNPANRAIIETVFDDAGTTGNRVLVVPDTGKNDPYFIDWPSRRTLSFPQSLLEAKIGLLLTEQAGGAV